MARKRKAVDDGSSKEQPRRSCRRLSFVDAAERSDAGRAGSAMDSTDAKPKRNPRRAAKDRWEEEKLMTSDTSQLIDLDLVRLLAQPAAWDCLEESEKGEILSLLPTDVHPNPHPSPNDSDAKIPPLPESFLRYSNNWRDGIRQFQIDLQNGHYDPRWLRDAEEAMKQRAAGQFDKFKEQEFEEFWGQKQRLDRSLAAGKSSQVKLSTLIEHGVVRKGDIWQFSRGFSTGGQKILVEKEARIIEIDGPSLTFAVPPGQRVFLNTIPKPDTGTPSCAPASNPPTTPLEANGPSETDIKESLHMNKDDDNNHTEEENRLPKKRSPEPQPVIAKRPRGRPRKNKVEPSIPQPPRALGIAVEVVNRISMREQTSLLPPTENDMNGTTLNPTMKPDNGDQVSPDESQITPNPKDNKSISPESPPPHTNYGEAEEVIISNIQGPTALCNKILEVDGRITEIPNGNAWKEIRSHRDNQDMGSLWEIRQAWFLRGK